MKVKQIKKEENNVTLDVLATAQEVDGALHAAKVAFAQSMGLKPPSQGANIDEVAEEQMGIKDLDSIVQASAIEALVPLALDKKNICPSYPPTPKPKTQFKHGEEFKFEIEVALKPEYELKSYDPVEIKVPPFKMQEGLVDDQLKQMAERYTTYEEDPDADADKVVEKGDHIKIALQASENGKLIEGLSTDGRTYTAGLGYMPEGFEKEIIGMKAGETKQFQFEGPDFDEDMNERTQLVDATVTVLGFEKEVAPEINDEWIAKNMPMYKDLNTLKADMLKSFEKQAREQYDTYCMQVAAAELSTRFEGKIADEVYEAMRDQLMTNFRMSLQQQGKTWEQFVEENGGEQQFGMLMMMQVRQTLVQGFSLDAVFRHEKMMLSDEDLDAACAMMNPNANPRQTRMQFENTGRGFALRESAQRLKANKFILENAKIEIVDPEASVPEAPKAEDAAKEDTTQEDAKSESADSEE